MTESALQKMSEAEYLRSEETSPYKREYVDGFTYALHGKDVVSAQAGALSKHGLIALNIATILHRPARQKGCKAYASDMRVRIGSQGHLHYYYPDIVVTCEQVADDARYLQSPCFITEILSESTRNIDRREKLTDYTALPSLQGYLIVDTALRSVRLYTRDGEGWREDYAEGEGKLTIPCVDLTLTLADVYDGTSL